MNTKMIRYILGKMLGAEALLLMLPALVGAIYGEHEGISFLIPAMMLVCIYFFTGRKKPEKTTIYGKDGMVIVALAWLLWSVFGALPFVISREIPDYIDALFETVSGFTTTGSSILTDVEALSKCMLFWRSFTHWVGGMGVLVFLLAVSSMGGGDNGYTMHLLRAESPGPNVGKLVPKMRKTAGILYLIYILLTVLDVFFLVLGDMSLFEAVCTAFGTVGTGGFGIRNDSISSFSPYIQNVCTVFMMLCGVNFTCFYLLLIRQFKSVFRDEELRLYLGVALGSVLLIVLNLRGFYETLGETVRHAAFQVATIMTTTGYATTDYELWPGFSKAILLGLMIIGASAGSTGGGFKCGRVLLVFKSLRRSVQKIVHPQKVQVVRVNGQPIDEKVIQNTNAYLAAYAFAVSLSFLLISVDGFSITTNLSAVLACFNNIGPGFEMVGPTCNFAGYSTFSKLVLIWDMLAGRLEIFPILILFSRTTWAHR